MWDLSNRWGNAPSQKDDGETIGNAFKGTGHLYDAATQLYGAEAKQVPGVLPVTPFDVSGKPTNSTPQSLVPGSGVIRPDFMSDPKLHTSDSILDFGTADEQLAAKRKAMNLLAPYSDEPIYGF